MKVIRVSLCVAVATATLVSCKKKGCTDPKATNYSKEAEKDDSSCIFDSSAEVPTTYAFADADGNSTVAYSGQTDRLNQLKEMTAYMKKGVQQQISAEDLKAMFSNKGDNGGGNFTFSSSKQLENKCFSDHVALFKGWMDSLANASAAFGETAASGQAGTLPSGSSTTYLFDKNGIEHVQLIEKGLMGAVFLYQATQVYFGSGKMDVDNATAVDASAEKYYTAMEHHWDEAFGYFGAPVDFPNNTSDLQFWAKYCNKRDGDLGSNAAIMNAFLKGRTAIVNKDYTVRDQQIEIARKIWEKVSAAQAVAYLEGAKTYFASDKAKYLHELSEAYAFIHNLTYCPVETRTISIEDINTLLNTTIGDNFWNVTTADLDAAINKLKTVYNLS